MVVPLRLMPSSLYPSRQEPMILIMEDGLYSLVLQKEVRGLKEATEVN